MLKKKTKNGKDVHSSSRKENSQAFKFKVVKLYQEEEYTRRMLSEEFGKVEFRKVQLEEYAIHTLKIKQTLRCPHILCLRQFLLIFSKTRREVT